MFETWNKPAFAAINASSDPNVLIVTVAQFLASWMIYIVAAALVLGWIRGDRASRPQLVLAGASASVALLANLTIAALWYHARPFELGIGHQFLAHLPEASFPSDHATVLFAISFGLLAGGAGKGHWIPALFAALGVAWSRVYLGVHWPLDMVGSLGVAAVVVAGLRGFLWRPLRTASAYLRKSMTWW